MPRDRNGTPLAEGDVVCVPCRVTHVLAGDDWANLRVETLEPMHPGHHVTSLMLNAKQVVLGVPPAAPGG